MVSPPGKKSSANKYLHKQKQKRTLCVWKERKRGDTKSVFGLQDCIDVTGNHMVPHEVLMLWIIFARSGLPSRSEAFAFGDSALSFEPRIYKGVILTGFFAVSCQKVSHVFPI